MRFSRPGPTHRESNFAPSFVFLRRPQREAILRLYSFCRALDDVSDSSLPPEEKRRLLEHWESELRLCYEGTPGEPIMRELKKTIQDFHIGREPLVELLDGVRMDLDISRYRNFVQLSQYCYRVAGTVGVICLDIFNCPKEKCRDYAVALGLAFQITNILRDIKEDAGRGRIYLPQDELLHFGYTEEEMLSGVYNDRFVNLMRFQAERATDYFRRAADLLPPQYRRRLLASEIMAETYFALLKKIEALGYNVFDQPIRISRPHKYSLAARTAIKNVLGLGRLVPA